MNTPKTEAMPPRTGFGCAAAFLVCPRRRAGGGGGGNQKIFVKLYKGNGR